MHNSIYASGFLYNLKTRQILLLQNKTDDNIVPNWSTFGGESQNGEDPLSAFQRIAVTLLKIELKMKKIFPVYDYFHETHNMINHVFYAEVLKSPSFSPVKESTLSWVSFEQTVKLLLSTQTKQDIIVGKRVIDAKNRNIEALKESLLQVV